MIVVDTSALFAVLKDEATAAACRKVLASAPTISISAGTFVEAMIVAVRLNVRDELRLLIAPLPLDVVPVTSARAEGIADAYARWGKGAQTAGLNWGDCFAYALARELGSPLLYVGDDFARTDIASALPA